MRRFAALLALVVCGCSDLRTTLAHYGFAELMPPSTLFAPGTVVWVKHSAPFAAGVVCTQRASLGSAFKAEVAPSASSAIAKATEGSTDLGADAMRALRADGTMRALSRVNVSLTNVEVLTLSDEMLMQALPDRDRNCTRAINARLRAGFMVTMIASALRADVVYRAEWSGSASVGLTSQSALVKQLAPRLGLNADQIHRDGSLTGTQLFWGVIDDPFMAAQSAEHGLIPTSPEPDLPERSLPPGSGIRRNADIADAY